MVPCPHCSGHTCTLRFGADPLLARFGALDYIASPWQVGTSFTAESSISHGCYTRRGCFDHYRDASAAKLTAIDVFSYNLAE